MPPTHKTWARSPLKPAQPQQLTAMDSSGGGSSSSSPPPSKKARVSESNPKILPGSPPKTRVKDAVFVSDSSGGGASRSSSPPGKKARIPYNHPKLLPRSTPKTQAKAAEAVVLAAAMLRGGTLDQHKEAEALVANEIAPLGKEVSDLLILRLKGTAKEKDDGTWWT
ncbi:hypothetical protein Esi_0027_0143 [Ectocarpus siliculosus]|uniref:Uncharacterized protein n=1 Tax=Ectocarpus siliculosus TaxID=2880 RepID=D7FUG6_ECTSI|nr:hypothetical protein Esi_0027_0143 [Ectocarpus siliculosus]|eukprot:CBJ26236.1 hypothetical protein Esi_0027_0143 [Ectocarpus siliculosus]